MYLQWSRVLALVEVQAAGHLRLGALLCLRWWPLPWSQLGDDSDFTGSAAAWWLVMLRCDDAKGRMTTKYARAMQAGKGETW